MAYFEWDDSLTVGIPLVDSDHKLLIDLLNQLHASMGDSEEHATLGSVLNALLEYTEYHFIREEKVMEVCGYPDLPAHRVEHGNLTRQVKDIEERFRSDKDANLGSETLVFVKDWLNNHIKGRDTLIKQYAQGNNEAIRAAEEIPRLSFETQTTPFKWESVEALIIDDNSNMNRVLVTILQSLNSGKVRSCASATEALEALETYSPNIILCDNVMDEMDGITFAKTLRAAGNHTPIIMITGYGSDEYAEKAAEAGISAFLEKPIDARKMLLTITQVLS